VSSPAQQPKTAQHKDEVTADRPPRKRRQGWGALTFGLLLGTGGIFASRLGRLWPGLDPISNFTPHFIMMCLAFALAGILPRGRVMGAVVLLILMVVGYGSWPHYLSEHQGVTTAPADHAALRVATFNIQAHNTNLDDIAKSLVDLNADVVTLIEFKKSQIGLAQKLSAVYPYAYTCHQLPRCSAAIFSKLPFATTSARSEWEGPPYVMATFGADYGNVTVLGVHFQRFPNSVRQFQHAQAIVKLMEAITGNTIVMGDFNATPFSRVLSLIEEGTALRRRTALPSWNARLFIPQFAIDHILTSPLIKPLSNEAIGSSAGSDHFPVTMLFSVPRT
jgi:endonuclease/exonuclease/phosphatase (EEP) superfamily protein YafD